jgi:murein L,D-transpeptidase YafK
MIKRIALAASLVLALAACQGDNRSTRHLVPIPPATMALMASKGMSQNDPILMRAYKKESEIEVWKRGSDGRYALLKTYPMCRWSGQLGPKTREGDRQAPEGFYTVAPAQMNPNSSFHLSFDLGYPNAYDRAHGRTGAHLMVHGSCSSSGCFAMTDEAISEVYALARESFASGQRSFQFQSYPFRRTWPSTALIRTSPSGGT